MDAAVELSDASQALDLVNIRIQLMYVRSMGERNASGFGHDVADHPLQSRLEDTITFHLIERVQFPLNRTIYIAGALQLPQADLSFMDWMLRGQERLHSLVRRYESPDEHPFFPDALQSPILKPLRYPSVLHPNTVNINHKLKLAYVNQILPAACSHPGRQDRGEMQENYGSSGTCDVACLQALSRRVHFGKFVAEAKFRQDRSMFEELIRKNDREAIAAAITDEKVEKKVLERLRLKAATYGTDPSVGIDGRGKINVEVVVAMYRDIVIPLTKEVEVEYLMQRLDDPANDEAAP